MFLIPLVLLAGAIRVNAGPSVIRGSSEPTVTLDYGTFKGASNGSVELFLGIPYAQPPVGDLRLRKPRSPLPLTGTQNASAFGHSCLQQSYTLPGIAGLNYSALATFISQATPSEDCLNLNIFRPASVDQHSKLPVVIWFFGGGFTIGDASSYNASNLVSRSAELGEPIIYVSVNYRLNAFGFLAGQEVLDAGIANLGIYDQSLASQWVQSHISSFGGDPRRVTLWGQSAGGVSVTTQMVLNAKVIEPPFRAAIVHSTYTPIMESTTDAKNQHYYNYLVENTNCSSSTSTLDCLRQVPAQTLLDLVNTTPAIFSVHGLNLTWSPSVDGVLFTETLKESISGGRYAKVPVLGGQTDDEGTLFSLYSQNITTNDEFISYIANEYFPRANSSTLNNIAGDYSEDPALGSPFDTGNRSALTPEFKRIAAFQGDFYFQAGRREAFSFYKSTQKIWSFLWKRKKDLLYVGSVHGGELPEFYSAQPSDFVGTDALINFINNLDPNYPKGCSVKSGLSSITWPSYNENDQMLVFSDNATEAYTTITDDYRHTGIQAAITLETELDL